MRSLTQPWIFPPGCPSPLPISRDGSSHRVFPIRQPKGSSDAQGENVVTFPLNSVPAILFISDYLPWILRQDFVSEKKIYQARTTVDNLASFSAEDREAMMQLLNKQKKRQAQGGPGGPGDLGDLVICFDASL